MRLWLPRRYRSSFDQVFLPDMPVYPDQGGIAYKQAVDVSPTDAVIAVEPSVDSANELHVVGKIDRPPAGGEILGLRDREEVE